MEGISKVWSITRQCHEHLLEIVCFQRGANVLRTFKNWCLTGNRCENWAAGSCDVQAASQEFLSPQNTNQLVHNPLWHSVWHARGDWFVVLGSTCQMYRTRPKQSSTCVFLLGALSLPLPSAVLGVLTPPRLALGIGLWQNRIPSSSHSSWVRYGSMTHKGPMRLSLTLLLEVLRVVELLEYKILDFSVIWTDKNPLFAIIGFSVPCNLRRSN